MSDSDRLPFDRASIAAAVRPVPLEALRARARRRRQGRIAGAAAAVVTLIAAGAGLTLAPGRGGAPAVPGRATPTSSAVVPTDVVMLSDDTAVVFWSDCRGMFSYTTDRGRLWSPLTGTPVPRDAHCRPTDKHERWLILDTRNYWYSIDDVAYVTNDAGASWRPAAGAVKDVAAFPDDARVADCGAASRCAGAADLGPLAVGPDGTFYRLTARPDGRTIGRYQRVDGVLWASLHGDGFHVGAIGRSADGGATWQTRPLGAGAGADAVAGLDRNTGYALCTVHPGEPQHVLRTGDGGATWQDVKSDVPLPTGPRDLTVRTDDVLLIVDADPLRAWSSNDRGAHFEQYEAPKLARSGTGPGVAWAIGPDPARLVVTTDARTWTNLPLRG